MFYAISGDHVKAFSYKRERDEYVEEGSGIEVSAEEARSIAYDWLRHYGVEDASSRPMRSAIELYDELAPERIIMG